MRAGAVTFGNFDGVHVGHRDLVRAARRLAETVGGPAVAVTFDPPPAALLRPVAGMLPLTTLDERADQLRAAGADGVAVLDVDAALLALSPEAFFEEVVGRVFGARAVAEGYDFRFGRARAGDTALLRKLCAASGVLFGEVPARLVGGEPASSSRVRAALLAGDLTTATDLLGRAYSVSGVVESGARRGRTIGFPTANVGQVRTLLPCEGVYAARVFVNNQTWPAAANLGPAPTFGEPTRKLEAHLIDFAGDIYGRTARVEFVARLRDTRPFAGAADLVEQLRRDVLAARAALNTPGDP